MLSNYNVKKDSFASIFDADRHAQLVKRGERKFSQKAVLGIVMITLYKEEPRFHQPSLLLELLMDLEVELTKWRCKKQDDLNFLTGS